MIASRTAEGRRRRDRPGEKGGATMEREATLDELLAEPAVVALMNRDGVDPDAVRRLLAGLRERCRGRAPSPEPCG
jgi:hypothetical protein